MGVLEIIKSQSLTYEQKVNLLAQAAENTVQVLNVPERTRQYFAQKVIDDLGKGPLPIAPATSYPTTSASWKTAASSCSSILRRIWTKPSMPF